MYGENGRHVSQRKTFAIYFCRWNIAEQSDCDKLSSDIHKEKIDVTNIKRRIILEA